VAANAALYATFCAPPGRDVVEIDGGLGTFTLFTVNVAEKLVVFPAVSVAVIISVCWPLAFLVLSQLKE